MGIGFKELVVILVVVLVVFGAKKLKTIGSDLGAAVRGFKKSMNDGDAEESVKQLKADAEFSETREDPRTRKRASTRPDAPRLRRRRPVMTTVPRS